MYLIMYFAINSIMGLISRTIVEGIRPDTERMKFIPLMIASPYLLMATTLPKAYGYIQAFFIINFVNKDQRTIVPPKSFLFQIHLIYGVIAITLFIPLMIINTIYEIYLRFKYDGWGKW